MSYAYKALEFDTILSQIVRFSKTNTTKEIIHNLTPFKTLEETNMALNETETMRRMIVQSGFLPLTDDFDIYKLFQWMEKGQLWLLEDVLSLRLWLKMTYDVKRHEKEWVKLNFEYESIKLYFNFIEVSPLLDKIDVLVSPDGFILDDASPELFRIRKQLKKLEIERKNVLQQILSKKVKELNEPMIVLRNDRYCLPVKVEYKNTFKGIIHDESSSGTTVFIEPIEVLNITNELSKYQKIEKEEIERLLLKLLNDLKPFIPDFIITMDLLIHLDLLQSKALYAKGIDAYKPNMNTLGLIDLISARHPLIPRETVVPISLRLDSLKKFVMITGPNTGGKTVALKTVGLISLMAQCGILVPADTNTQLSIFDGIYADIGDDQSIAQSLSTFSSHLTKINVILKEVTQNQLILLDELGSGTDPVEGSALAMSILDFLSAFDIRLMVTTHYSELKVYAYSHPHIANASVAFDQHTLKPLYQIHYGVSGSSNALFIAKRLGLDSKVIENASTYLSGKENDLSKAIKRFEIEAKEMHDKELRLSEKLVQAENEIHKYESLTISLEKEKESILKNAKAKADQKLKETIDKANELLDSLKNNTLKDHEIAKIKYDFKQLGIENDKLITTSNLKVGDTVYIKSYDQYGKIIDLVKEDYKVKFGLFELVFPKHELRKDDVKEAKKQTRVQSKHAELKVSSDMKMDLDLRGFRYEDVKEELDKFLDSAMLNHMKIVRVIHGFGTGAVRKAVYEVLKRSPYVESYRYGGDGEGLNGATVITLK